MGQKQQRSEGQPGNTTSHQRKRTVVAGLLLHSGGSQLKGRKRPTCEEDNVPQGKDLSEQENDGVMTRVSFESMDLKTVNISVLITSSYDRSIARCPPHWVLRSNYSIVEVINMDLKKLSEELCELEQQCVQAGVDGIELLHMAIDAVAVAALPIPTKEEEIDFDGYLMRIARERKIHFPWQPLPFRQRFVTFLPEYVLSVVKGINVSPWDRAALTKELGSKRVNRA